MSREKEKEKKNVRVEVFGVVNSKYQGIFDVLR